MNRVREAINRLKRVPEYAQQSILHYAEGYCEFLYGSAADAGKCVGRALDLVAESSPRKLPLLNGLGICKLHAGEFANACEVYSKAFDLACRIGDDAWSCIVASNLCSAFTHLGSAERAIGFGLEGIRYAQAGLRQPRSVVAYMNLANAYLLGGHRDEALQCVGQASQMVDDHTNWEPRIIFHAENAC